VTSAIQALQHDQFVVRRLQEYQAGKPSLKYPARTVSAP
jgi:carbamoyl-phosphate synthase large subunit